MHKIMNMHNCISELPEDIGLEVSNQCVSRTLTDGECLYRQGDKPDACFQVASGRLKICNFNHDGQELLHTYLIEGDCVGDLGLIIDEHRINCAFACGDTRINVLNKVKFLGLYEKYPEMQKEY